ncbi:MAG: signal peptide peptidase SppA [Alphaproteobacteria bacterium]|nr:signal peptide peptidase SppA [Alphaproteobacteria bacterium]
MSDQDRNPTVWGFIKGFGKFLIGLLMVVQGIVGLAVLLIVVGFFAGLSNGVGGDSKVTVPKEAALVINPNGVLVEQAEAIDPFEQAIEDIYGVEEASQIDVHDLARAIRQAKEDDRIKGIVLDLGQLFIPTSSASKAHYLAAELKKFKESGKPIIAVGDYYSQDTYLLAAQADRIMLHDMGNFVLVGYGRYGTYYRSFLEKIKATPHVFRVGTYKAAVEPFLRDDMSAEAKEANQAFLSVMWDRFIDDVSAARGLTRDAVLGYADNYNAVLQSTGGDMAKAALDAGFVDELKSRPAQLATLVETFGKGEGDDAYKQVGYRRYLLGIGETEKDGDAPNIAVVTASGAIVDGDARVGEAAGGDSVARLLKKAREDENVKAVVLRVDSPGGSTFASEVIRDEVIAIKEAGKPLVVSMGSLAASGGYWISAPADEIWASPTTITGSIGIFAFFPTFENTAAELGVSVDGVGTSALSSLYATGIGPLEPNVADIFQQSIEDGYRDFLQTVAEGRNLSPDYIDTIAQGRVWIGEKAIELGLVDNLGDIDEAIASAAKLAGLEKFDRVEIVEERSPFQAFLSGFGVRAMKAAGFDRGETARSASTLRRLASEARRQLAFFDSFNDPNGSYARCLACE